MEGGGVGEGARSDQESRSAVSFTFQKKAKVSQVVPVPQEQESKDFVLSLVGNKINSTKPVPKRKEYVIPLKKEQQVSESKSGKVKNELNSKDLNEEERRKNNGGRKEDKTEERRDRLEKKGRREGKKEREERRQDKAEGKKDRKSEEELQLEKEAAEAVLKDVRDAELRLGDEEGGTSDNHIISMLQNKPKGDFKADLETKPPQSSMEEYDEMPISEFGKAALRGMGWKEGMALGKTNKGMIEPIEFLGRPHTLGLGAMPKPKEPPKKHRIKKPGEEERKVQGPYIGKDGRVKHVKNIGEAIPEQPLVGFVVGNFALVLVGPHEGLYGQIVSVDDASKKVMLQMKINDQVLRFSQHHLELVSKKEYVLGRRVEEEEGEGLSSSRAEKSKEKLYGLITRKSGTDVKEDRRSEREGKAHTKGSRLESEDRLRTKSNAQEGTREESKHSIGSRGVKRTSDHLGDPHHYKDDRHHSSGAPHSTKRQHSDKTSSNAYQGGTTEAKKKSSKLRKEDCWLSANLRVKMVDRTYKNGRHYNTKVEVVDVVSLDTCVCQTEDGKLLEGVTQNMVETVVPRKALSVVKIVRGKRKNKLARVVDQDRAKAQAVIQLNLSKEVMDVDFDDICEYLGETEVSDYLG